MSRLLRQCFAGCSRCGGCTGAVSKFKSPAAVRRDHEWELLSLRGDADELLKGITFQLNRVPKFSDTLSTDTAATKELLSKLHGGLEAIIETVGEILVVEQAMTGGNLDDGS
jgi:hypothetical protein